MDEKFLIDTNIAIYFLAGVLTPRSLSIMRSALSVEANLSIITQIELLGWEFTDSNQATVTEEFVKEAVIYPLDENVVQRTIEL